VPTPPPWLVNLVALAEWRRIAPALAANKMLTVGNLDTLADYVMLVARFRESWLSNATPNAALLAIRRKLAGDLGLSAMNLPTPSAKPNRFTNNALRRR
jgi:hypothetical protein